MALSEVLKAAEAHSDTASDAVRAVINAEYLRFSEAELLSFAQTFETHARLVFTAQVRIAGEIDGRKMAAAYGASSTSALLRETLTISQPDARTRVTTAAATLPQPAVSGGIIDPVLPVLGAALADGEIGVEQTRTIVSTMTRLPAALDPQLRDDVQETLVEHGILIEPKPFARFARAVAEACDPDGKLDERPDPDKVELHIGTRNAGTGLTRFGGYFDDEGVELLNQSIQGLTKPRVEPDGSKDKRPLPVRQGQALKEVLRMFLDHGDAPTNGGERPHVTVTMRYNDLKQRIEEAVLAYGGPISAAEARRIACDAGIIPVVMGSESEVLDVGRLSRLFTPAIRKALALRDKGCAFPGCDRPVAWCDAHHVVHWAHHGESAYTNGCLLCPISSFRDPQRSLANSLRCRWYTRIHSPTMG
jgi:hypothetical protein